MSFNCRRCREHVKVGKMPKGVTRINCPVCRTEHTRLIGDEGQDLGEIKGNAAYNAIQDAERERQDRR